ncbi:MAG TPA: hypothetical protein PKC25_13330, partial [Candidatus Rifleibacterium sp.]|nr:hypothetical protein [Candidatus Rifleibacterium sp.]
MPQCYAGFVTLIVKQTKFDTFGIFRKKGKIDALSIPVCSQRVGGSGLYVQTLLLQFYLHALENSKNIKFAAGCRGFLPQFG